MIMRYTNGVLFIGAMMGAYAVLAGSPALAQTQVAFVTNNASAYWTMAQKGVEAAEKRFPDLSVQFIMPADGTAATQRQDVDDCIARGAKAIAISPVDPANQTRWLDDVAGKAALITQDSDAPLSKRICYIGTDNHGAGLQVGQEIKKCLGPAGGQIMLFVGVRDAQNAKDREQGIRDALAGSNVTILDVRTDDADHARAKTNAADALVRYPSLAMEVGIWSYNGPAILSAIEDAHKVGKVKIVCFDQEDATLAGIKSGAIYATVVQQPYQFGVDAVKMMDQLVKGDRSGVPASGVLNIPTEIITGKNVAAYQARLNKLLGG
jgi:ribose transport system substrate-binding protein